MFFVLSVGFGDDALEQRHDEAQEFTDVFHGVFQLNVKLVFFKEKAPEGTVGEKAVSGVVGRGPGLVAGQQRLVHGGAIAGGFGFRTGGRRNGLVVVHNNEWIKIEVLQCEITTAGFPPPRLSAGYAKFPTGKSRKDLLRKHNYIIP